MKKINQLLVLVLIITLTFTTTACGKKSDTGGSKVSITKESITLKYLRVYDESDALDEIIKKYQDDHPNIRIVVNKVDLQSEETIYDYQRDLIKQIADGAGPDMFMINNNWLPYQKNQIAPMPSGLMTTETYADLFPSIAVNDFIDSDKIYAIPYYLDNLILYYNTDIFKEKKIKKPPKTWQEVSNLVPQLTKYGSGNSIEQSALAFGVADGIPRSAEILANLMMQYGAEMTSPDHTRATFNLPAPDSPNYFSAAEALDFYTSFANPSKANYTYTDQKRSNGDRLFPMDVQAFIEGKSAMFVGYSYHIAYIRKLAPSLHFETAPLPQLRPENPVVIANYWGETVSKNSQHPNEAWDFIKFVVSKSGNLSLYTNATKRVPSLKSRLESYTDRQYYGSVALQANYSQSWYRKNTLKVEDIFFQMVNSVLHYNVLPLTAVEVAARDINALKE